MCVWVCGWLAGWLTGSFVPESGGLQSHVYVQEVCEGDGLIDTKHFTSDSLLFRTN